MSELSERAKELVERAFGKSPREEFTRLIEQALLAERVLARRDAMEEAAKIALTACDELKAFAIGDHVANALRAAAETEKKA